MATLTGILKVTPATLKSYATTFGTAAKDVNSLTNNMLNTVDCLCRNWYGDASSMYLRKFNTLRDDMNRMHNMMHEHSADLQSMAQNYENAEDTNKGNFSGLAEDVIV